MNIGLEVLNGNKVNAVPSMEQMFDQYIACEKLVADTNRFSDYGDQLFTAFDNVMSLGKVAAKYNSSEALDVINSLVGQEFGGTFSAVEAQGALKSIWTKIKEFFAKIWEWIKTFFYRVLNFFGGAKGRLQAMLKEYDKAKTGSKAWSYKGLDFAGNAEAVGEIRDFIVICQKTKKDADNGLQVAGTVGLIEDYLKKLNAKPKVHKVASINDAKKVISGAIAAIDAVEPIKKFMGDAHQAAGGAVAKLEKEDPNKPEAIKAAKANQQAIAKLVKGCNGINSIVMRSVASVMANGKFKADK